MSSLLQKAKLTSTFLVHSRFGSKHRSVSEFTNMSSDEKEGIRHGQPDVDVTPVPSPTASTPPVSAPADVDDAWKYLNAHRDATSDVPDEGTADIKHIRRKVDYRIVPLVFFLYVLQYTDKLVLNVRLYSQKHRKDGGRQADQCTVCWCHDDPRGPQSHRKRLFQPRHLYICCRRGLGDSN